MEPYGAAPAPQRRRSLGCFSWALAAVLTIITAYSGMLAYRLKDDAPTVASVATSFWVFLALLLCTLLSLKEAAAARPAWEDRLKVVVWGLTTTLFFHVAYMTMGVAALALHVALLVWFMPVAGWAMFFIYAFFNQDR
ncbi:hypothetical protein ACQ4PT_035474 [Festuca glaucescens]